MKSQCNAKQTTISTTSGFVWCLQYWPRAGSDGLQDGFQFVAIRAVEPSRGDTHHVESNPWETPDVVGTITTLNRSFTPYIDYTYKSKDTSLGDTIHDFTLLMGVLYRINSTGLSDNYVSKTSNSYCQCPDCKP